MKYTIKTEEDILPALHWVMAVIQSWKEDDIFPFTLYLDKNEEERTLTANAFSHAIYKEIAEQLGDRTARDVRMECKLTIGVPILRGNESNVKENLEFKTMYDKYIKGLDYDEKLELMEWLPVTRIMSKKQMTHYLEQIMMKYSGQGVVFTTDTEGRFEKWK